MEDIIIKCLKRLLLFVLVFATILTGTIMLLKRNDMLMNVFDNIRYVKIIFISSLAFLLLVLGGKICRCFYVLDGRVIVIVKGYKYSVSLKTFFKIARLQIILFAKRSKRRMEFVVKNIKNTLLLLPVWLVFITILWLVTDRGFYELMDQSKFSIFTSIVLVCVSELRRGVSNYREKLSKQHNMYCDLMGKIENLVLGFVKRKPEIGYEIPMQYYFYTDERFAHLCEFLKKSNKKESVSNKFLQKEFNSINLCLKKIQQANKRNDIYAHQNLDFYIMRYLEIYEELERLTFLDVKELIHILDTLYQIICCIRFQWRKDLKIDRKIAFLLYDECEDKDDLDCYLRLLVDDEFDSEYLDDKKKTIRVKVRSNVRKE